MDMGVGISDISRVSDWYRQWGGTSKRFEGGIIMKKKMNEAVCLEESPACR